MSTQSKIAILSLSQVVVVLEDRYIFEQQPIEIMMKFVVIPNVEEDAGNKRTINVICFLYFLDQA